MQRTNNKKLGNAFETRLCEILSGEGFWAHNFAQNQAGQPVDIIASRRMRTYIIDCKVCSNGRFAFSRVEENQRLAMEHWHECGNYDGWFALLLENKAIYMVSFPTILSLMQEQSSMSEQDIIEQGLHIQDWLWLA